MKIQKSCTPVIPAPPPAPKTIANVKPGTLFMFGAGVPCGPFLRIVPEGAVNLNINQYYGATSFSALPNYRELPNAYLVTGEE